MSHPIPTTEVTWTCPNCGTINHDDFYETTFPTCSELCAKDDEGYDAPASFDWEEVVTPDKYIELNAALALAAINR